MSYEIIYKSNLTRARENFGDAVADLMGLNAEDADQYEDHRQLVAREIQRLLYDLTASAENTGIDFALAEAEQAFRRAMASEGIDLTEGGQDESR